MALKEEEILRFWQENKIFEKSLALRRAQGKEFVFYEGPPTANGKPGIHHLEVRAFKDVLPRYKTMRGYHVRRKGGWDTHGLPVEIGVEKKLGLKSKKEIENFGIAKFNSECKESVWEYLKDWNAFTERIGFWVDQKNPYVTYTAEYMESVWAIIKKVNERGLLYKDYKVLPWCPRCGTALSSHELAQGYQDDKDLAVTVKFKIIGFPDAYFLAWTTTPWTLPGNVALAVGEDVIYVEIKVGEEILVLAKERLSLINDKYEIVAEHMGKEMVGMKYEPLYPYLSEKFQEKNTDGFAKAYQIYVASFVNTIDGTGIVHTAVMYGQDDFDLGTSVGLPKHHLVNEDGHFIDGTGFLSGKFVKDEEVAVDIIKDLAGRGLLFKKEKYEHSYPHCWRCKTPLIYYARDSWYIRMSELRDELLKENEKINWEPGYFKDGRFGEWLREIKDWAISRERYWGTPLPIWNCEDCKKIEVIGSVDGLLSRANGSTNNYWIMRHGQSECNLKEIVCSALPENNHVTEAGFAKVKQTASTLKESNIDVIFSSDFTRTRETAEAVARAVGYDVGKIIYDSRLREVNAGEFEGGPWIKYHEFFNTKAERYIKTPPGGESTAEVRRRVGEFIYEIDAKYSGKNILIISHGLPLFCLQVVASGVSKEQIEDSPDIHWGDRIAAGDAHSLFFRKLSHNDAYELDLHRPYIDDVTYSCACGGKTQRVKEVLDVWFDSGAMPFAQDHYPFDVNDEKLLYPADYISEAIDQTRGWFYTLLAIGVLMEKGTSYKNVICLGHILDSQGKKMSKSVGNVIDPTEKINKYGVDVLRLWMYSVNQPGESKNFDEKTVDELSKKVFTILRNVASFYELYKEHERGRDPLSSPYILDKWILSLLTQLARMMTENLDAYRLFEPARAVRDFAQDLSQWYLRRSRDRMKGGGEDAEYATATLRHVLLELSKLMAPLTPFFAEEIYQKINEKVNSKNKKESVHLESWPTGGEIYSSVLQNTRIVREVVSSALELRSKANIKVRQSLSKLTITEKLDNEYLELIKDEVNVKEVVFGNTLELDTTITPELKREGEYRDLIREVQDLRKEKGLKPGDVVTISLPEKYKETLSGLESDFKKAVSAKAVEFGGDIVKLE